MSSSIASSETPQTEPSIPIIINDKKVEIRPPTEDELIDVYKLRYKILREPWGQHTGSEQGPEDKTETHLAVFENETLVATARLDRLSPTLAQIRCVAVSNECQGRGYGQQLMKYMEIWAKERLGIEEITLHARINAVMFYHRLGYTFISPSYNLWDQIQHYEMRKKLTTTTTTTTTEATTEATTETNINSISNQRDYDLYTTLTTCVQDIGLGATRSLIDVFLQDLAKRIPNATKTVETTPTNDGKTFVAPK